MQLGAHCSRCILLTRASRGLHSQLAPFPRPADALTGNSARHSLLTLSVHWLMVIPRLLSLPCLPCCCCCVFLLLPDGCCCSVLQPDPPLSLSSMSGSIATQVWQVAAKENQLDKVQDELQQVSVMGRRAGQSCFCVCDGGCFCNKEQCGRHSKYGRQAAAAAAGMQQNQTPRQSSSNRSEGVAL
jgi:hypothetical protein